MQVQIEEHEFKWVIPEFRLGPSFNQTLEFCYDNRKIVM